MIATAIPNVGLSVIARSIKALYGMATEIDTYIEKHIGEMKGSQNPTIARTGRVTLNRVPNEE